LTVAFGAPADWLPDFDYYPYVATVCIVLGIAALAAAAWLQTVNVSRDRQSAKLTRAEAERDDSIVRARRSKASFNALSAKEQELTRVKRDLATASNPSISLMLYGTANGDSHKYFADISALKERVKVLEKEIRELEGEF